MNWKNALLLLALVVLSVGLVKTLGNISDGKKRLAGVVAEVSQTAKQKENLEKEIKERESESFLEREARNRLNLIKPGERIVILPKKEESLTNVGESTMGNDSASAKNEPNWLKWKRLFFE